ncbi:MAG: hypothetical protein WBF88_06060, partial [Pusillimonas sp.]
MGIFSSGQLGLSAHAGKGGFWRSLFEPRAAHCDLLPLQKCERCTRALFDRFKSLFDGQLIRQFIAFLAAMFVLALVNSAWAFGTLTVSPNPVAVGQEVTLSWPPQSASCIIYQNGTYWTGTSCSTGEYKFTPSSAGEYSYSVMDGIYYSSTNTVVLAVEESGGQDPDPVPVIPEISAFTLSPPSITTAQTSTLSWSVQNAESCDATGAWTGGKSASGGSEILSALAAGSYSYTLTCTNAAGASEPKTVNLQVLEAQQVSIDSFTISSPTILMGGSVSLNWSVSNAQSCTRSGNWSGSTALPSGGAVVTTAVRNVPGDYSFTLTCSNGGDTVSKTVELIVEPGPAEITSFAITNYLFNPYRLDGDTSVIAAGGRLSMTANVNYHIPNSCTLGGKRFNTNNYSNHSGSVSASAYTFDKAGDEWILACDGYDGSQPNMVLPIRVVPATEIVSFTPAKQFYDLGEPIYLSWQTEAAKDCRINGEPVPANAQSHPFPAAETVNPLTYELQCETEEGLIDWEGNPASFKQGITVDVNEQVYVPISGRIFGEMDLNMALIDTISLPTMRAGPKINGFDGRYAILGFNQPKAYWMWDFDTLEDTGEGRIYLGGSNLLALNSAKPPYRLFSPGRARIEGQHVPDVEPPLEDHIGTFTSNGDGTYKVRFNYQIFFSFAGWPLAELYNQMSITANGDGTWKIRTLDAHPDGITYFDEGVFDSVTGVRVNNVSVNDGIPGVVLPRGGDTKQGGGIAYNATFPARVSPGFSSERMVQVTTDGNGTYLSDCGGGVPLEFYSYVLRGNFTSCAQLHHAEWEGQQYPDVDGDGIPDFVEIGPNLALPINSDMDSIADFLKPQAFAGKRHFAGNLMLGNGERAVVYSEDTTLSQFVDFGQPSVAWEQIQEPWFGRLHSIYGALLTPSGVGKTLLPATDPDSGQALNYALGSLVVTTPTYEGSPKIRIYFNQGVPAGLRLFNITLEQNDGREFIWDYERVDGHIIEVAMRRNPAHPFQGVPTVLALAYTGESRDWTPEQLFNLSEPGYQALLALAENLDAPEPSEPDPIEITSFAPASASITLGNSVNLLWQAANADTCVIRQDGNLLSAPTLPVTGNFEVTPGRTGTHTYELICLRGSEQESASTSVIVQAASTPIDPNALTGIWTGNFSLTMRVAGSASQADPQGTVLGDSHNNAWTFNFDEGWAELDQGMLSVGFPFHVQDLGNADPVHDRAFFTDNGDGTYTLHHGYQIYNPYVGNPRTDMTTTFRIVRDGNQLIVTTLDPDGDGVPGLPVPNVFPLTVSPGIDGVLTQDGSANPNPTDPTDPGNT